MKKNKALYLFLALLCVWCPLFMGLFDKDKPAASTSLRNSNPEILTNWSDIQTAINQDHEFENASSGQQSGEHTQIKFLAPISTPTNAANKGWLYSKDVSAVVELHWLDESGNELQMTSGGDLYSSAGLTVTTASTFNGSITLGAGDDLIGSATSDITFNTNKFTVAGATGNTVVAGTLAVTGITTVTGGLADGSTLAAATETADGDRTIVDLAYAKTGDTVQHDTEGGYSNCDVDSTKTKVFSLYFTGTLDADSSTSVAHGITGIDKILFLGVVVFSTNTSNYQAAEVGGASSAVNRFTPRYDGTNVIIESVGSAMQSQKYRIKIDYIL